MSDATEPSAWAVNFLPFLTRAVAVLNERTAAGALPAVSRFGVWSAVVSHVMDRFVEGYSRVKRCSELGRGLMSLDVGTVYAHAARVSPLVPACLSRDKAHVDGFVKAFYETSEGALLAWVLAHRAAYPLRQARALLLHGIGGGLKKPALKHALGALEDMYCLPEAEPGGAVDATVRVASSAGGALERLGASMMGL